MIICMSVFLLNLVDNLNDPDHEEHEELLEWLGDEFDPEAFDIKETNDVLKYL